MKKKLNLLALTGVIALAACSTPAPSSPTMSPPGNSWVTPGHPTPANSPVTFGGPEQSWLEVTADTVQRPDTGAPCTATASERPDHRVAVEPLDCSGASTAVVTVTELSGQISHQFVGPQRLVFTQRAQGVPVAEPTFRLTVNDRQIWPK